MQVLARNAARRVQLWMLQNPEWFSIDEVAAERAQQDLAAEVAEIEQPVDLSEVAPDAGAEAGTETEAGAEQAQSRDTP